MDIDICALSEFFLFQAPSSYGLELEVVLRYVVPRHCINVTQLFYQLLHIYKIYKIYTLKH